MGSILYTNCILFLSSYIMLTLITVRVGDTLEYKYLSRGTFRVFQRLSYNNDMILYINIYLSFLKVGDTIE